MSGPDPEPEPDGWVAPGGARQSPETSDDARWAPGADDAASVEHGRSDHLGDTPRQDGGPSTGSAPAYRPDTAPPEPGRGHEGPTQADTESGPASQEAQSPHESRPDDDAAHERRGQAERERWGRPRADRDTGLYPYQWRQALAPEHGKAPHRADPTPGPDPRPTAGPPHGPAPTGGGADGASGPGEGPSGTATPPGPVPAPAPGQGWHTPAEPGPTRSGTSWDPAAGGAVEGTGGTWEQGAATGSWGQRPGSGTWEQVPAPHAWGPEHPAPDPGSWGQQPPTPAPWGQRPPAPGGHPADLPGPARQDASAPGPSGARSPDEPRQWWADEASQPFTSESGRRLSPRSMVVGPINQLRSILLPIAIGLVIGGFNPWLLAATGATVVVLLIGGFVTWQTLRYEITDDRIEIRKGLIRRERRTIPLERIRGVDVTSSLLHRMLGVSVVHIEAAAGSSAAEDGKLDAVDAAEADRLRVELLRRRAVLTEAAAAEEPGAEEAAEGQAPEPQVVTYFEMPRSWYLFGALSLAHLLTPFALLATAAGLLQQSVTHVDMATDAVVGWIDSSDRALLLTVAIVAPVVVVLLMPVFAVVSYTITHWGFTLTGRDGSLVAERGLFTRRSVTLEKRRIRGHELQDSPLERTRGAVRLRAIVTGLGESATRAVLLPTGPRPRVAQVVERALDRYEGGLRRHPRAALYRRLVRSVGPFVLTGALGVALGWTWLVVASGALALLGVPLGVDRYRSLGHGHDGAHVSVRSGSLQRGQAVVDRSAVIGWTWTQTLFQRRSGLANLQVNVGAGAGGYTAQDASLPGSVDFAAQVTPEMVRPFLARPPAPARNEDEDR